MRPTVPRAIKLTVLVILTGCLQVNARTYSQTVSLSCKDMPLTSVFSTLEKQTGLSFFFNVAMVKDVKPVTLELRNVSLELALREALKDADLDFYRMGKTIFIIKKTSPNPTAGLATSAGSGDNVINVEGRVLDEQGLSMRGATVTVKGTSHATLTNELGEFSLKGVTSGSTLLITHLGYQRIEVEASNTNSLLVKMSIAENVLDRAEVIAYGKTSARIATGDVTTVPAAVIERQPVNNPLIAIQGRVPGMFIQQTNGYPGGPVTVQIMGLNSISQGNSPLYVVDGVPYPSQSIQTLNSVVLSGAGTPLSFLNPGDIESISVLKDADATAIYGSRAANGAILITTKKGRAGKTLTGFNLRNGIANDTRRINLLNREQYLAMRREAFRNDGLSAYGATDYDVNGTWDSTRSTDWQKVLLGGNAQYTDLQGNVSGGTTNTQFLVGGDYHRETTVFSNQLADQKGSLHFNFRNSSVDQKFTFQLAGSYLYDANRLPASDLSSIAIALAPDAPALYGSDGTLNWAPNKAGNSSWTNPLSIFSIPSIIKTNNLISSAIIGYQIIPGLELRGSLGYTNLETNETLQYNELSAAPENRAAYTRSSFFNRNNINSWIVEPQAEYNHVFLGGHFDVVAGMTIHQNNSFGQSLTAIGFSSSQQQADIGATSSLTGTTTAAAVYKYNAVFGRINYNWADQWIVNLSARRDGSSRFGSANQFHNFASSGLAWIFSQTRLIRARLPFLSFGKLSSSYGVTGNDQIGDYQYLSRYNAVTGVATPYQGVTGLTPAGLANPYLQWEQTRKFRGAIDLGFFRDRILISAAYFLNRSSDELLSYQLPVITGFGGLTSNFPAVVQNSGWEMTLHTINLKTRSFNWTTSANLTIPFNKLVAFPGIATSSYASQLVIGQPANIVKYYPFLGVNPATGGFQFGDAHGNPTPTPNASFDRTVLININPRFYGGIDNSLSYKGWQLDFFFEFSKKPAGNFFDKIGNFPGIFSTGNQPTAVLRRWQKPGDITSIQRFSTSTLQFNAAKSSNVIWADAAYIRLKNVSISWQMPESWRKKAHLQNFMIFAQGENLLTFTRFKGLDPSTGGYLGLPPLRVITLGLQVGL